MSGIAGVRGEAPADVKNETIARLLAMWGGGRPGYLESPGVALGAAGARTFTLESSRFQIAADARLDGRAELAAKLGLRADEVSDGALILAAWERWGSRAPIHLLGDFALAVWDIADRTLHLVRDAIGMRPLFFTLAAFASRASALCAVDPRHGRPDEAALRDHLLWRDLGPASFFDGVECVRPGEIVTLRGDSIVRERWWTPSTRAVKRRPEELLAECRHLLDQAVTDRIGDAGDVLAAHFSAGLDSSTAAALAARHKPKRTRLLALTAVPAHQDVDPRGRLVDEGPLAARAAASLSDVEHRSVPAHGDPVAALRFAAEIFDQPLPNPHNHMWVRAINDEAARAGAHILLIGQIGNYSFSMSGDPYRRLKDFAKRLMRRRGTSKHVDPFVRDQVHALHEPIPAGGAERRLHFLQRIDPGPFIAGVEDHWSLSTRDPFADRRVMEFSLGISETALASFGDRGLARAVAAGLLPRDFVANRRRGYQSADWIEQLRRHRIALHDLVGEARNHDLAAELVDLPACEAAIARLEQLSTPSPLDEQVYRIHLPRALAVSAFIAALPSVPSQEPRMAQANILR